MRGTRELLNPAAVEVGKGLLAGGRCVWSDEHQSADNKYMRTFLLETELSVDDSVPVQVCGD